MDYQNEKDLCKNFVFNEDKTEVTHFKIFNRYDSNKTELIFDINHWIAFYGIYIAEGSKH